MKKLAILLSVAGIGLMACAGSDGGSRAETTSTTQSRPPGTRSTTSTTATPSTTTGCPSGGSTVDVRDGFPNRMSALVGKDVRTGAHKCFERFVIELQPADPALEFPGYWVRYVPKPISLSPSGIAITMRGDAVLMVSLGSWMAGPEPAGYIGPKDVFPTNVVSIREYRLVEDFEGQSAWALGLDRRRPFAVSTLTTPPRLVVDVASG